MEEEDDDAGVSRGKVGMGGRTVLDEALEIVCLGGL